MRFLVTFTEEYYIEADNAAKALEMIYIRQSGEDSEPDEQYVNVTELKNRTPRGTIA